MSTFESEGSRRGLSRRSFLAGIAAAALTGASATLLSACGGSPAESAPAASAESASEGAAQADMAETGAPASAAGAAAGSGDKVLVAYFSGMGHTEKAAKAAADALGADLFEIEPANAYSQDDLDFNDDDSRVVKEYQDESRRDTELKKNAPDNWADYGTVLVGYPIWWGDAAWAMHHFASGNDFTGKTVIPFCTSYSSPIGLSDETLENLAGTGDWQEGKRFDQEVEEDEVRDWAKGLKN